MGETKNEYQVVAKRCVFYILIEATGRATGEATVEAMAEAKKFTVAIFLFELPKKIIHNI